MKNILKNNALLFLLILFLMSCDVKRKSVIGSDSIHSNVEKPISKTKNSLKFIYSLFETPNYGFYMEYGDLRDYEIWKVFYYENFSYEIDSTITYNQHKIDIFKEALDTIGFEESRLHYTHLKNAFILTIDDKVDTIYIDDGFSRMYKIDEASRRGKSFVKQKAIDISPDFYNRAIPKEFREKLYNEFYSVCYNINTDMFGKCKEKAYYQAGYKLLRE